MKRESILEKLKEKCPAELINLYNQFKEEIKDFFHKYDLFNCDNIYSKIFACLTSKTYISYQQISEIAAINLKGVIKYIKKIEIFLNKILESPRYEQLKAFINITK